MKVFYKIIIELIICQARQPTSQVYNQKMCKMIQKARIRGMRFQSLDNSYVLTPINYHIEIVDFFSTICSPISQYTHRQQCHRCVQKNVHLDLQQRRSQTFCQTDQGRRSQPAQQPIIFVRLTLFHRPRTNQLSFMKEITYNLYRRKHVPQLLILICSV